MNALAAMPAAAAAVGILLLLAGVVLLARRRTLLGIVPFLAGVALCLAAAAIVVATAAFMRLLHEADVAEIRVRAVDPAAKVFMVTVTRLDGDAPPQQCPIEGDEWVISGQVQKWKPWANLLGVDATYELEQLSNRYRSAESGNGRPITACELTPPRSGFAAHIPAWFTDWFFAIDRRFGSANYMPLADGAVYRVLITQSGFNAEPENDVARTVSP